MIFSRILSLTPRTIVRQSLAKSHAEHREISFKGNNFPFDITKPRSLAIKMIIFLSIPFSLPYIVWRRRLIKNRRI